MICYTSFSLDELTKDLVQKIKNQTNPFEKPIIVFHDQSMIDWFKSYWLKHELDILMNVDLITINELCFKSFTHNKIKKELKEDL